MNFYTLDPLFTNVEFFKSVGSIPYFLSNDCGYNSYIVCFDNEKFNNERLDKLNLEIINRKFNNNFFNYFLLVFYLISNAKKIDVLNCYHFSLKTFFFFFIYKIINNNGIVFYSMDMDYNYAIALTGNKKGFKYKFASKMHVILFKYLIDVANIETRKIQNLFFEYHDIYKEKLKYVPIFIDLPSKDITCKKNQIISVGRIGTYYKASEIILNSFKKAISQVKSDDWILMMIGPISEDFKEVIDQFFNENSNLKNSIIFTGNIDDRDLLFKIYSESKVFCLPSRSESFGIVFPEAVFYGNYLIATDVGVAKYLIEKSKFGKIVEIDNVDDISNKLVDIILNYDLYSANNHANFEELINEEFSHEKYTKKLDIEFKKLKNQ